jgi:hypothetical protein
MQVSGISGRLSQMIRTTMVHSGQREWSQPEHDMTEGIATLAEDKRLEAALPCGLSQFALQRQTCIAYKLMSHVLHCHNISWLPIKSMIQAI